MNGNTLFIVFEARGIQSLMGAFNGTEKALLRVSALEEKLNKQLAAGQTAAAAQTANQLATAMNDVASSHLRSAAVVTAAWAAITVAVLAGARAYEEQAQQIMNIMDLTGASSGEAARANSLFGVAGVKDAQALRDLVRLGKDSFSEKGQGAMMSLGVNAQGAKSGLDLFNQIADALNRIEPGLRKTQLMQEIFGARGVTALLPLLRMTRDQRDAAMQLGDAWTGDALKGAQEFSVATGQLGEAVTQDIIVPFERALIPSLTWVANGLTFITTAMRELDAETGGVLSFAAAFATTAVVLGGLIKTVTLLRTAFLALGGAELVAMGPIGWLIGGVLAIAGGAYALFHHDDPDSAGDKMDSSVDKFGNHVDRMGGYIDKLFGVDLSKGGIPKGLTDLDINQIAGHLAMGIG